MINDRSNVRKLFFEGIHAHFPYNTKRIKWSNSLLKTIV